MQLEALSVAVRGADGESVTREEVWSPRAAFGQILRLVQLLTLRTLWGTGGGHNCIARTLLPRRLPLSKKKKRSRTQHFWGEQLQHDSNRAPPRWAGELQVGSLPGVEAPTANRWAGIPFAVT